MREVYKEFSIALTQEWDEAGALHLKFIQR